MTQQEVAYLYAQRDIAIEEMQRQIKKIRRIDATLAKQKK